MSARAPGEQLGLCLPSCDTPSFSPQVRVLPQNTFQKKYQDDQDSRDKSLFLNFDVTSWVVITGSWACRHQF